MIISSFLFRKYPFCVNLIQKFKRVFLRRNLLPTPDCLIDALPLRQLFFRFFLHPEYSFSTPSPRLLIIGERFQSEFETIYLS